MRMHGTDFTNHVKFTMGTMQPFMLIHEPRIQPSKTLVVIHKYSQIKPIQHYSITWPILY